MSPSSGLKPTFKSVGVTTSGDTWLVNVDKSVNTAFTFPASIATSVGTTTCTCTNLPKEIHYTAFTTGGSTISSVILDSVFDISVTGACTNTLTYEQTYSFIFKESSFSRIQSGSPGYKKGFPIMAGTALINGVLTNIESKEQGFQLYGADDTGTCILSPTTTLDAFSYGYYSDPVLTFGNGAVYGCKLSFTNTGAPTDFATFCTTTYSQVALINNLITNLKYVGIYGNSNPHFINDWIKVEDESSTVSVPTFDGFNTCTWNGAYSLKFYYTKLGTKANPQYKITRVRLVPERVSWKYTQISAGKNYIV